MSDEPKPNTPYWERPEWPEQLAANIEAAAQSWEHDWGPFLRALAERSHISLSDAILMNICSRINWWTAENIRLTESYAPVIEHMKQEIKDLKEGDKWKDKEDDE